jgi:hypothetical protein
MSVFNLFLIFTSLDLFSKSVFHIQIPLSRRLLVSLTDQTADDVQTIGCWSTRDATLRTHSTLYGHTQTLMLRHVKAASARAYLKTMDMLPCRLNYSIK